MYELDPATFVAMESERSSSMMRLLRYPPPVDTATDHVVGMSAHLQLLDRSGTWVDAPVREDHFTVIVGDMLERLTNGRLRATRHRVADTPWERYSLILFNAFDADAVIAPLRRFVDPDNPPRYGPTTQVGHINAEVTAAMANRDAAAERN